MANLSEDIRRDPGLGAVVTRHDVFGPSMLRKRSTNGAFFRHELLELVYERCRRPSPARSFMNEIRGQTTRVSSPRTRPALSIREL